jgi:CheY-like chemotaxis protein
MAKILLVEDNPANVEIVTRFLSRIHKHQVIVANDGPSGLLLAHQEMPDLIIMDMGLPGGMDGWEATRRLKADEATRAIPVLAFTAATMPEEVTRSQEAGCDDVHGKGASDLKLLIEKIERLLKR